MRRGQGLLETIIALAVIMTGLVSVIALTISNLSNARETAQRYQAINLAREGLELVRNLRDSNWLAGRTAFEGIFEGQNVALRFVPGDEFDIVESIGSAAEITKCDDEGYTQGSVCEDTTPFARTLRIETRRCKTHAVFPGALCDEMQGSGTIADADATVALEATSTVTWQDAGQAKRVTLSETFYDWR